MTATLALTNALIPCIKERLNRIETELLTNTHMTTRAFINLVEEKEELEKEILDMEIKVNTHGKEEWISQEINETMLDIHAMEKALKEDPHNDFLCFRLARMEAKLINLRNA